MQCWLITAACFYIANSMTPSQRKNAMALQQLFDSTLHDMQKKGLVSNFDFYIEESADRKQCIMGLKVFQPVRENGIIIPFQEETTFHWQQYFDLGADSWFNLFAVLPYDDFMHAFNNLIYKFIEAHPGTSELKALT